MSTLILGISGARGIVGDGLDEGVAYRLAASFARVVEPGVIVLGRDPRPSGPMLVRAVIAALSSAGNKITDLGVVPTPTVQVAVETLGARGGIVVTASHNPPAWNALKFVGSAGTFLGPAEMQRLEEGFAAMADVALPVPPVVAGTRDTDGRRDAAEPRPVPASTPAGKQAIEEHVRRILAGVATAKIRGAGIKVVVDAVHGAGAVLVAPLLEALGVAVAWIDGEPNGRLPERPEPRAERLGPLCERLRVENAQVGFALDPDGDRCAVVLPDRVLGEEWTLPLCAVARLCRGEKGPLVTNLSTSSLMDQVAARFRVPLHRTPVGEAHVVARIREMHALLGGEGNGGVIDPVVHLGRDAGVAIALLLELEASGAGRRGGIREQARGYAPGVLLKRRLQIEGAQLTVLEKRLCRVLGEPTNRDDGLKWTWETGWLHLRPSGTEPILRVLAEAAELSEAERLVRLVHDEAEKLPDARG
jgi:phosphomannomutase